MQKTSTRKVILKRDRNGVIEEHLRIKIWHGEKNPDTRICTVHTADFIVRNFGEENESLEENTDNFGKIQKKDYFTTYEDYEIEKAQLLAMFQEEITQLGLTGTELDDYLLLKKLEVSLEVNPAYGLAGNEWI